MNDCLTSHDRGMFEVFSCFDVGNVYFTPYKHISSIMSSFNVRTGTVKTCTFDVMNHVVSNNLSKFGTFSCFQVRKQVRVLKSSV